MTRRSALAAAAHHEAGHAVARWWLGFDVDSVAVLTEYEMQATH